VRPEQLPDDGERRSAEDAERDVRSEQREERRLRGRLDCDDGGFDCGFGFFEGDALSSLQDAPPKRALRATGAPGRM
jgi:hypothetical protein